MLRPSSKLSLLLAFSVIVGGFTCTWTDDDTENFHGMLILGTVIGVVFAIIVMVVASVPLCCGIMRPQGNIIAGVVVALGLIICFVPLICGSAQGAAAADKMCERCEKTEDEYKCTAADKREATKSIAALGILVAYLPGLGFLCIILGITAMTLGCCIFCKCCKMAGEVDYGGGGGGVNNGQGVVIGNPYDGGASQYGNVAGYRPKL